MQKIIDHFLKIVRIPHCSKDADALMEYLVAFAKRRGYETQVDAAKNIRIYKGVPKICLQAHYDMVCVGSAPKIEPIIKDGWMSAKASSLGADNGMAIAMMMALMDGGADVEFLLTSDEEIGLVGASNITLKLLSPLMLNLDSEEEGVVTIGCAGGVDIVATKPFCGSEAKESGWVKVEAVGFSGGHSGVDIDKGVESAISALVKYLESAGVREVASFRGGSRRNAISSYAEAIVRATSALKESSAFRITSLQEPYVPIGDETLLPMLAKFKQGVWRMDEELNIPSVSINLAIVDARKEGVKIELSARAMDEEGLKEVSGKTKAYFEGFGYGVTLEDKYPAWKPQMTPFTTLVGKVMKRRYGKSVFEAIHAGLECGVLSAKFPSMQFASIGPTIHFPHSAKERVDLNSVERTYQVVKEIIKEVSAA